MPSTAFDFSDCLNSLVIGDLPAGCFAEPRQCLLLSQDDAPAKGNLDQSGQLAVKPFRLQRLEFFAGLRCGDSAVLLGIRHHLHPAVPRSIDGFSRASRCEFFRANDFRVIIDDYSASVGINAKSGLGDVDLSARHPAGRGGDKAGKVKRQRWFTHDGFLLTAGLPLAEAWPKFKPLLLPRRT